ncbi:MAG: hypothetical protein ACJA0Q_000347 [Saprospiraceae bacterium]|jgi:hypothetical protein
MKNFLFILIITVLMSSCEDPVDIEISNGVAQLSVDAFVNNLPTEQTIYLKMTKNFFETDSQAPVIGASVKIVDSKGAVYHFTDVDNIGKYSWGDSVLIHEGLTYDLEINYNDEMYTSTELANPVPAIDSLVISPLDSRFGEENNEEEFQIELFAIDIAGRTDHYWIKLFRNDSIDTRSDAINVSLNGANGPGADGVLFIPPIRFFPLNDFRRPYLSGESVRVEIHSINKNAYFFFLQVVNQINNSGLFAVPLSNVKTNIESSSSETAKKAVGIFSVSMVSVEGKDI